MSYYHYYKYSYPITFQENNELGVIEISSEFFNINKIKENTKRIIQLITNLFKKVFNWIKAKINKVFKSSMVKLTIDKIKTIKKRKSYQILKDIDVTELFVRVTKDPISTEDNTDIDPNLDMTRFISQFFREAPYYYLSLVFDRNNKVYNLSDIIAFIDDVYESVKDKNIDAFHEAVDTFVRESPINRQITYGSLVEHLDELPKLIQLAEKYYQDKYKELSTIINLKIQELSAISKDEFDHDKYFELQNEILYIRQLIKLVQIPVACISIYTYILTMSLNKNFIKEYLSIPYTGKDRLFHLSFHPDLDKINGGVLDNTGSTKPLNMGNSNSGNIFTNKISFSPTIEGCASGIGFRFDGSSEHTDMYLYEGLPDNTTLQLLPSLVAMEVGEYFFSNEIAIVSPIKIRKLGKVRIWQDNKKDKYDPSKYYKIEFLEGGL